MELPSEHALTRNCTLLRPGDHHCPLPPPPWTHTHRLAHKPTHHICCYRRRCVKQLHTTVRHHHYIGRYGPMQPTATSSHCVAPLLERPSGGGTGALIPMWHTLMRSRLSRRQEARPQWRGRPMRADELLLPQTTQYTNILMHAVARCISTALHQATGPAALPSTAHVWPADPSDARPSACCCHRHRYPVAGAPCHARQLTEAWRLGSKGELVECLSHGQVHACTHCACARPHCKHTPTRAAQVLVAADDCQKSSGTMRRTLRPHMKYNN